MGRNSFGREAIKNREAAGVVDPTLVSADSGGAQ
jgi:hypothetical protein